jgi:glycosyltransferase involved in cell wall biosynthesis
VPVIWPCGRAEGELPRGERAHESRRRARELFGAREDDVVILTAARMHPQKRPLDLVRLAGRFRDDVGAGGGDDGRAGGRVRFVLVGGGDLEEEVDAAIAATNGAPILRLPFRTDVPELIAGADVGCLVSDYEGLPVFLIECLQMGRPFLGTAVGEMGHVLRETGAGIVVETPGDLDALEAAVARLCDPSLRAELGERARAGARRFDVEACAEAYARAFLGEA